MPQRYVHLEFYRILKELTVLGFFTSKDGATKTLRYVQTPGEFKSCEPYIKEERAWFSQAEII